MKSTDSQYVYDTLRSYNISYILVWKSLVHDEPFVEKSNIGGLFTYNFLEAISNGGQYFSIPYQNDDVVIIELKDL